MTRGTPPPGSCPEQCVGGGKCGKGIPATCYPKLVGSDRGQRLQGGPRSLMVAGSNGVVKYVGRRVASLHLPGLMGCDV